MSFKAMSWAWEHRVGLPIKKLILMHVADSYNEEKKASWFSVSRMADRCECDRKTVIRHLKGLCDSGIIRLIERGNVHGKTNKYTINFDYEASPKMVPDDDESTPKIDRPSPRVPPPPSPKLPLAAGDSMPLEQVPQCHPPSPTVSPGVVPPSPKPSGMVVPKQEGTVTPKQVVKPIGEKFVLPTGIPEDKFGDHMKWRKKNKLPDSVSVQRSLARALIKSSEATGISIEEILDHMAMSGWRQVKPDWVAKAFGLELDKTGQARLRVDNAALVAETNAELFGVEIKAGEVVSEQ